MSRNSRPILSVVVPVYRAREWIECCVRSLTRQTLDRDKYEVVIVFNGPDDGSRDLVEEVLLRDPDLNARLYTSESAGVSKARNLGVKRASGEFVSFVDADDWVSEDYLELLAREVSVGVVPVAQIVEYYESGIYKYSNSYNRMIVGREDPYADPNEFYIPLSFMACKAYPIEWARTVLFDESLNSSEDVIFNYELFARYDYMFSLFPAVVGATYFRRVTPHSVSRGDSSKYFLVEQRLAAMRQLKRIQDSAPKSKRNTLMKPLRAQMQFIGRYTPGTRNEKQDILDEIVALGVLGLPWQILHDGATRLVVATNFSPSADTGAIVTAKRIRNVGEPVDVISSDLSHVRARHWKNSLISSPYVHKHRMVQPGITSFSSVQDLLSFINAGMSVFSDWVDAGAEYQSIYSRSMWPHSHLLAAAIKRRAPDLHWVAEFSDPNSLTVEGKFRTQPEVPEELAEKFLGWGSAEHDNLLNSEPAVFRWAELLPYLYADELIFTNGNQLKIMLEHAPPGLRADIKSRAVINVHPTLPAAFYEIAQPAWVADSDRVNLAYFGDFYKTRGMSEIFDGLNELTDAELSQIRLTIFTASKHEVVRRFLHPRVASVVEICHKLEFLEFLAVLKNFDVLIVNDAQTAGHFSLNPYLPSKISDYRGASTPVWAVTESGSILSSMVFEYESRLGDKQAAVEVLRGILSSHKN